jgi:hypothetical protein
MIDCETIADSEKFADTSASEKIFSRVRFQSWHAPYTQGWSQTGNRSSASSMKTTMQSMRIGQQLITA